MRVACSPPQRRFSATLGTIADAEGSSRSRERGGLDPRFQDAERDRGSAAHRDRRLGAGDQIRVAGEEEYLFPSEKNRAGYQRTFKTAWAATLRRAKIEYFRIYDLRSTYATRRSAGGVADEWVTQLVRQGDAKVFKKYSQMTLQMKREAPQKLNRTANEGGVLLQAC